MKCVIFTFLYCFILYYLYACKVAHVAFSWSSVSFAGLAMGLLLILDRRAR